MTQPSKDKDDSSKMPSGEIPLQPICSAEIAPAIVISETGRALKTLFSQEELDATLGQGGDVLFDQDLDAPTPQCFDTKIGKLRPIRPSAYRK